VCLLFLSEPLFFRGVSAGGFEEDPGSINNAGDVASDAITGDEDFRATDELKSIASMGREYVVDALKYLASLLEEQHTTGDSKLDDGVAKADEEEYVRDDVPSSLAEQELSNNLRQAPSLNAVDLFGGDPADSAIVDAFVDQTVDRAKLDKVLSFSLPAELDKSFDELTPEELVDIVERLKENMNEAVTLLVDSKLLTEAAKMTTGGSSKLFNAENYQLQNRKTNKLIDKAVGHMRGANSVGGTSSLEKLQAAGSHDFHRRAQEEMKRAAGSQDFNRRFQEEARFYQDWESHGSSRHDGEKRSGRKKSHYKHAYMPPGMTGWNAQYFLNHHGNGKDFNSHSWMHHGRRGAEASSTDKKMDQCGLLRECVGKMTFFDLFAYFYSDDIDPATGHIDKSTIRFDEGGDTDGGAVEGVENKLMGIRGLLLKPQNDANCDKLLQQFHRTIEVNGVPEWEGASVSQVCLAENAQVYIDLAPSMPSLLYDSKSLRQQYLDAVHEAKPKSPATKWDLNRPTTPLQWYAEDKFVDGGLSTWFIPDFHRAWQYAIEMFISEQFDCADKLWESADRKKNHKGEEYVFRDSDDARLIPIGILKESGDVRDDHGQITNIALRAYETVSLKDLNATFDDCHSELFKEYMVVWEELRACGNATGSCDDDFIREEKKVKFRDDDELATGYEAIFDTLVEGFEGCVFDHIDTLQHGIGLIFGEQMNFNFICSLKTAIVDGTKSSPGTCCLDAPYQLNEAYWGQPVSSLKLYFPWKSLFRCYD
jgi:hypothetical protein